jgi:hypothetical protein
MYLQTRKDLAVIQSNKFPYEWVFLVVKRLALGFVSLLLLFILIMGWEGGVFVQRMLTNLVDSGVAVDEQIPEPSKRSISHQVFWRGNIENIDLRESSGLTYSRSRGLLWSINDSGSGPEIFALSESGAHLGKWHVMGVEPNDWEGMDSFRFNGKHYLLIADTGDNFRVRKEVSFIVVEEPDLDGIGREVNLSWETRFRFPDGPKDVEAVAVDLESNQAVFLNKRGLPLSLYSVPLFPIGGDTIAKKLSDLVPVPRYRSGLEELYGDVAIYLGLPTGMDLFENKLLVTTYGNAYLYDFRALEEPPEELALPYIGQREAITFGFESGQIAYVSRERPKGKEIADIFEIRLSDQSN